MTLLAPREPDTGDGLVLLFDGGLDGRAGIQDTLRPFIDALEKHAGGWPPERVTGRRPVSYSHKALWRALEERRDENSTACVISRTSSPFMELALRLWLSPLTPTLSVHLQVRPLSSFSDVERSRQFIELIRAWATLHPTPYAMAHGMADRELSGAPTFGRDERTARRNGFDQLYALYWLNVFGPKLVETIGREHLRSTPAHRVEELPDGSVLLVLWPTPADFASEPARVAQARAWVHLRPDLDFDSVLATLLERSAALAPVTPRFSSDLAPLLSRVVEDASPGERSRLITRLNAAPAPEPDEWLPASSILPPDVDDPGRTLQHYAALAERLVALFHGPVPSVLAATPASLTDLDFRLWREDFPGTFERQHVEAHAVPALGAYLGEVLIRHLGGQWIPRKNLDEAQVRVGDRAWRPFLRAARALKSREAVLDHSLTQLYRAAERHR